MPLNRDLRTHTAGPDCPRAPCSGLIIRNPVGEQVQQVADIHHRPPMRDMRPVGAPDAAVGCRLMEHPREGDGVAVGRPFHGQAVGSGQLDPGAVPDQRDKRLEARIIRAARCREMAHVVHDEGHRQLRQTRRHRRQVLRIDQELEMPAELPRQISVAVHLIEADAAAIEHVEPEPDDAGLLQSLVGGIGQAERDDADALQALRVRPQGLDHQAVVGPMDADLDQHAEGHACRVQHAQIGLRRRFGRRVAARFDEGMVRRQADDMGVGIDRTRRDGEATWSTGGGVRGGTCRGLVFHVMHRCRIGCHRFSSRWGSSLFRSLMLTMPGRCQAKERCDSAGTGAVSSCSSPEIPMVEIRKARDDRQVPR